MGLCAKPGFYIDPALDSFCCFKLVKPDAKSQVILDTIKFCHLYLSVPVPSAKDKFIHGLQVIAGIIRGPPPPTSVSQLKATTSLQEIFESWRMLAPPSLCPTHRPASSPPRVNLHESPRVVATSPPSTSPTWSPSTAVRPPPQPAGISLTPAASALTFHVTPHRLIFGNVHSPRAGSAFQQPLLPPAAPVLPVREPIAHRTRSWVPVALAFFASGGQFHKCLQYCISTAKSLHASSVAMGFEDLCTIHCMSMAETSNFTALCSALLHKDNPLALSVLDPATCNMLEHCQLRRDPWYKTTWDTLYSNELGRLCQGIGSGEAPNSKRVACTNTFFCINYNDILLHKRMEICHTMVVHEVQLEKDNPNHTQITIGGNHICYPGNVGTNTASLELLKLLLNRVLS